MDWNRIEGNWKEAKGKIKQKWGQLTDDDLAKINGPIVLPPIRLGERDHANSPIPFQSSV